MKYLLAVFITMSLAACSKPAEVTIDGSNAENYKASIAAVREALPLTQRVKFEAALKAVQADSFAKAKDRKQFEADLRARLSGKNAVQVMAEATSLGKSLGDSALDAAFKAKQAATENAVAVGDIAKDVAKEAARQGVQEAIGQ